MCLSLLLGWCHLTERPYQGRISLATQCKAGPRWQCWRRREHILGRFPCQPPEVRPICPTALLPMFQDSADTVAMICHSIDVVKNAAVHTMRELEFRSVPFTCCEQTSTAFLIYAFCIRWGVLIWSTKLVDGRVCDLHLRRSSVSRLCTQLFARWSAVTL